MKKQTHHLGWLEGKFLANVNFWVNYFFKKAWGQYDFFTTFISQGYIKLTNSDREDIYNVIIDFYFK